MKNKNKIEDILMSDREISGVGTVRLLKGRLARFLNRLGRALAYSSTRTYGAFFLSFGLLSLFLNFAKNYFENTVTTDPVLIWIGASLSALSVVLMLFDRPMCIALQDFAPTDYLFFEFFSIKRMHRTEYSEVINPLVGMFLGFIPAIVAFFVPIQWVLLCIVIIIFVAVSFDTPEFPMIFTLLVLPYITLLPSRALIIAILSLVTFSSYLLKVIIGKRIYTFNFMGALVFLFFLLVFISGCMGLGEDSLNNSLVFISAALAYFPVSNLTVNRRLADCAINAVVVSAIPITILAIIEFIVELPITKIIPPEHSTPGVSVFFTSASTIAAFLLVASAFTVRFAYENRGRLRVFYSVCFAFEVLALVLSSQPVAWLTAILLPLVFAITRKKRVPTLFVSPIVILPYLVYFLPTGILAKISDALGMVPTFTESIIGYNAAFNIFKENILFGVGIGKSSFLLAGGGENKIFNTVFGVGVELGVLALAVLAIIFLFMIFEISYTRYKIHNSNMKSTMRVAFVSVTALFMYGADMYIFEDASVHYLFWCLIGLFSSAVTVSEKEHDERLGYYGDISSFDSSVIDITLNR